MKQDYLRIIQIDGSEIYYYITQNKPLVIKNNKDGFNEHFSELLSFNLDVLHLLSKKKLNVKRLLSEQYTYDFISVTFDYSMKIGEDGEQITYEKDKRVVESKSPKLIRKELYLNGFILNNTKYVRYKRSSGSARSGNCLFIKESLYNTMNKWSNARLDSDYCIKNNLVSYEAYKALSLSSLIDTVKLKPHNILFVKDIKTTLKNEKVIKVFDEDNKLNVDVTKCDIENNLWDGEGLLDVSVFNNSLFADKGMMLLRNRFFKCCAFNTNLQEWFKTNKITKVNQLNGITFAKRIKEIKLVITESSLKYIKMIKGGFTKTNIKKWCDVISDKDGYSVFGIVKTDKPQRHFYGDYVETSYQLLNSIQLTDKKTSHLMSKNFDYIQKIRNISKQPEYFKYYLKGEFDPYDEFIGELKNDVDDSEDIAEGVFDESIYTYKKLVCDTLLDINRDILKTATFKYFVYDETINSLALKLYNGRVLVHGTYATLFGNPYELLLNIINKFDGQTSAFLHKDQICTSFFDNDVKVVGSRAPHITMGNLLYASNKRDSDIERWFNLTREIVIVDAIENNIQQRLNGADYDSDTMLITDDKVIVKTVKDHYKRFLVPFTDVSYKDNELRLIDKNFDKNVLLNLSDIDNIISTNKIGTIINYSQLLNSYYWDCYNKNHNDNRLEEVYLNIAKLAVLSGVEIDSAKRTFNVSTDDELNNIKRYLSSLGLATSLKHSGARQPLFFFNINTVNNRKIGQIDTYVRENYNQYFQTTMDFIWRNIFATKLTNSKIKNTILFSKLIKGKLPKNKHGGKQYKSADRVIESLETIYSLVGDFYSQSSDDSFERDKRDFIISIDKELKKIKNNISDVDILRIVINKLDKKQKTNEKRGTYSNLFLILFFFIYKLMGNHAHSFLKQIFISNEPIYSLTRVNYRSDLKYTLFDRYGYQVIKNL